jgi:serine protease Do
VDRGNVVASVQGGSPADRAGLKKSDILRRIGGVPVHSIADALYGLELAPRSGTVEVEWTRDAEPMSGRLTLSSGWRKSDLTWRPSMWNMLPSLPVRGADLTAPEKATLRLKPDQLAVRQRALAGEAAQAVGLRAGDILLGIDKELVGLDAEGLRKFVHREYLAGDRVQLIVLRDGKRKTLPLVLSP